MKSLIAFLVLTLSFGQSGSAQSYLRHEAETEKQSDFPGISLNGNVAGNFYAINLDGQEKSYEFDRITKIPEGTILKISSYIIGKELLDSLNSNTVSAKTNLKELREILSSDDPQKVTAFFERVAEKTRPAETAAELRKIVAEIKKQKTKDDPERTNFFKTGFIEVAPLEETDVRYFIPFDSVKGLKLDPKEGKVKLLQSLSLLTFKKIKANINLGNYAEDELKGFEDLEKEFTRACNQNCVLQGSPQDLVESVIALATHDFLTELDLDVINAKALFGQVCLISTYAKGCSSEKAQNLLPLLLKRKEVQLLLTKNGGSLEGACETIVKPE